jgi:ketosteroid isomerase-like protein
MRVPICLLLATVLVGCGAQKEGSAIPDTAAVKAAVRAHLDETSSLMAKGAAPAAIVDQAYWPDAMTVMEGVPAAVRGKEQLTGIMAASTKEGVGMNCTFTLEEPVTLSGDIATAFSAAICGESDKAMKLRTLYVWQNRDGDWKIIREMIATGALN